MTGEQQDRLRIFLDKQARHQAALADLRRETERVANCQAGLDAAGDALRAIAQPTSEASKFFALEGKVIEVKHGYDGNGCRGIYIHDLE